LRAQALTASGRGLLMISYRGYSGSTGTPTETGLHTDARTAYEWARQSYEASRLVAYGESLGTGVAVSWRRHSAVWRKAGTAGQS
jgi:fermentation-respiration switch protein FrsA (DUF1100 family)